MMTQQKTDLELFQELVEQFFAQIGSSDALNKVRAKAWEHFLEIGLPTRQTEVFRYLRMRAFYDHTFVLSKPVAVSQEAIAPHILPECRDAVLVFVNGHYRPELSRTNALPPKLIITPLTEAIKTYGAFLTNQWTRSLKDETDPFAALNATLHRDGIFLYMPPKTIVNTPVQLLNVIDTRDDAMLMMPRVQLFVGSQGQIDIVSTQAILSGEGYCISRVIECALEDEAHVTITHVDFDEPTDAWHFEATRAFLKRNSSLKTVQATDGGTSVRHDYRVALVGENAEAQLNGVWMLSGKNEAHHHVIMDHQAPYCRSMQLFKGVLSDVSHSSFEGKILVRQPAQKTEAFQLNNNLLLSDRAAADSKPNLEIFADDVKASHGATVGKLDEEQLFYMKTRGFATDDAQKMLVHAFCQEVVNMIRIPSLHQKAVKKLMKEQ